MTSSGLPVRSIEDITVDLRDIRACNDDVDWISRNGVSSVNEVFSRSFMCLLRDENEMLRVSAMSILGYVSARITA